MKKYVKTILLDTHEYEHLKNTIFKNLTPLQYTNYYYDTPDFAEINSLNAFYIQHFGMSGTTVHRQYDKDDQSLITELRTLTDGGINERLVRKLMLIRVGELVFERYIIYDDNTQFILDKNTYLNIIDYEISIESDNKDLFYDNNKISKLEIYLNSQFPSHDFSFTSTSAKEKSQRFYEAKTACS